MKKLKFILCLALYMSTQGFAAQHSAESQDMFNFLAEYLRIDHAMGGKAYVGPLEGVRCEANKCELRGENIVLKGAKAKELKGLLAGLGIVDNAQGIIDIDELLCRALRSEEGERIDYNCRISL